MSNHAALIRQENAGKPVLRRGRNFIEFDLGGGVRRYVTTIAPLHVRASDTEIDTTFIADTGAWQWKMAQADFQVHARSVFNAGNLVEWRHSSGEWVTVDPQSINWVNQDYSRQQIAIKQAVTGVVSDNVLSFPAGYGTGKHFSFIGGSRRLTKHITIDHLSDLPAPTVTGTIHFEAEWTISTSTGVDLWLDGVKWTKTNGVRVKTANRIEFRDTANTETLWFAEMPRALDANGESIIVEYEVRRQGGPSNLFITVRVPREWLLSATYPIRIDPTFTDGYGGDIETAQSTVLKIGAPDTTYGSDWYLNTFVTDKHSLLRFNLSSIAAGSTCNSATLSLYSAASATAKTYGIHSLAAAVSGWTEAAACWNHYVGTTHWPGSGGASSSGTDYEADATPPTITFPNNSADTEATASLTTGANLTATRIAGWFGATNTNYGLIVGATGTDEEADRSWYQELGETLGPKLVVDYTEGGGTLFTQSIAGTLTSSGAMARNARHLLAGAIASAGTLTRQTTHSLAGSVSSAGSMLKQTARNLAGSIASAGSMIKQTARNLAGSIASSGSMIKQIARSLTGSISSSGVLTSIRAVLVSLAGSISSAGTLTRQTARSLAGSIASAGSMLKQTARSLTGSIASSGVLTSIRAVLVSLAGSIASAGTLTRQTARSLAGSVSSSGLMLKQTVRSLTGSIASSGVVTGIRVMFISLAGSIASMGSLLKQTGKIQTGNMTSSGAITKHISISKIGTVLSSSILIAINALLGRRGSVSLTDATYGSVSLIEASAYVTLSDVLQGSVLMLDEM